VVGDAHAALSQVRMKHVAQYSIERETDWTVHDRNDTFAIAFSLSIRDILNMKVIFPYE
jgi:hypothetical protein